MLHTTTVIENGLKIIINTVTAGVNSNLSGYPLLIKLTSSNFDFGKSDGTDLRFFTSAGTELYYEVDEWSSSTSIAYVWVRIPTLYGNNNTQYIIMRWGYGATAYKSGAGVFSSSNYYKSVWHLKEDAAGTGTAIYIDSVGTQNGTDYVSSTGKTGIIGKGQTFAASDYISCGTYDPDAEDVTLSAWVYRGSIGTTYGCIFSKRTTWQAASMRYQLHYKTTASTLQIWNGTSEINLADINQNEWVHLQLVMDRAAANGTKLYINGELSATVTAAWGTSTTSPNRIGLTDSATETWIGHIDEVRLANTLRTADWALMDYKTQNASVTCVTYTQPYEKILYINSSQAYSGGDTAMTIAAPTGIQSGDVIIFWSVINGTPTVTDNNGETPVTQTLLRSFSTSGGEYFLGYRVAGASEPASYAWTLDSSQRYSMCMSVYRGVDTTVIYDVTPSASTETIESDTTVATASITPGVAGAMAITACGVDNAADVITGFPGDNFTLRQNVGNAGALADRLLYAYQSSVTWSDGIGSASFVSQMFSLKPK